MIKEKIKEIFKAADELRVLSGINEVEVSEVTISLWQEGTWNVSVRPAFLCIREHMHVINRNHTGKDLNKILDDALSGAEEELKLLKEGKTRGIWR
jgi:hypothetical protein